MSNELLELWKKRGITPQGSAQPKVEEKKAPPSFIPTAPKPEPVKAAPYQPAAVNPPAKVPPPTKHKTANDEMREIMEKKAAMQANPEPQKAAPKRTYLNEMQDTMKSKPGFQPMEFPKKRTAAEEMLEIMQKKQAPPQPKEEPPQEPDTAPKEEAPVKQAPPESTAETKKLTASEEMKEIMKKRAAEAVQAKEEPKRKTANEEMQEIMRLKGEKKTVLEPVKERKPVYIEEMKHTLSSAGQVHEKAKAPIASHEVQGVTKIDQDEQMRKIKDLLESQIKFKAGDNLELKPKPVIEQAEELPLETQEIPEAAGEVQTTEAKRKDSEGSDEPQDNPNVSHKPSGLFADD